MKNKVIIISVLAIILLGFTACKKTPEKIDATVKKELPTLSTNAISNITPTTATSGGDVTSDGNSTGTARGICWNTTENPSLENNLGYTFDGSGTGNFTTNITGLINNTTYYIAAYATNEIGTAYGSTKSFSTQELTLSEVTTTKPINITPTTATSGGDITSDGNSKVTARGICWNTTENPSLEDNIGYTFDGSGIGSFTSNITDLTDNTTYYVAAYATNERGTAYGGVKSFTTLEITLAVVTTITPSNIHSNSAISGGDILNDGNSAVTARGVCWNTTENPSLENNIAYTSDGSGTVGFISNITGLTENTTYYVAAYATNEKGTAYGQVKNFTTEICGQLIINYGGQEYHGVPIGTQCWMKENLNIGTRINGNQEMQSNSTIEKYCYDENEANCDTYGGLYQWDEMMQYSTQEGAQGICPDGWHIPTDNEWKEMEMELGMSQSEANNTDWRGTNEGEKLRSKSGWNSNGNGTNSSGFTAFPGGFRSIGGSFIDLVDYGFWWTSTEYSGSYAWSRGLCYYFDQVDRNDNYRVYGYSVRCLKD
ncbi:MAG: hypothetical protein B7C24_15045 [Bacteroidetes bacterium 4572_77]|nr:MAG: hypothetical protein B7C24_15045 [Bacteroidetes bacterium 4572_77]